MQSTSRHRTARSCGKPAQQTQVARSHLSRTRVMGATAHVRHGASQAPAPEPPATNQVDGREHQASEGRGNVTRREPVGYGVGRTEGSHAQPGQEREHRIPVPAQVGCGTTEDKPQAHHEHRSHNHQHVSNARVGTQRHAHAVRQARPHHERGQTQHRTDQVHDKQ